MIQHLPVHWQLGVTVYLQCWPCFGSVSQELLVGNKGLNAVLQASSSLWTRKVHELILLFNVLLMSIFSMKNFVLLSRIRILEQL